MVLLAFPVKDDMSSWVRPNSLLNDHSPGPLQLGLDPRVGGFQLMPPPVSLDSQNFL